MRKMLDQAIEMSHQPFQMSGIKLGFKDMMRCQMDLLDCQRPIPKSLGPIEDAILELQEENQLRKLEISSLQQYTVQHFISTQEVIDNNMATSQAMISANKVLVRKAAKN